MALGQAPFDLWFVLLLGLIAAFVQILRIETVRNAAIFGGLLGTGYFATALFWIVEPFFVDAETHAWMAPFALVGLATGLALFWAGAFAFAAWMRRWRLVALAVSLTAAEALRSYVLTGFPWAMPSQAFLDTPVMQWAAFGGQLGVLFGVCIMAAALAAIYENRRRMAAIGVAFACAAVLWGGGQMLIPPLHVLDDRPVVRLVQPNAPQDQKWNVAMMPFFLDRSVALSAAAPLGAPPALTVWPETALPMFLREAAPALEHVAAVTGGRPLVAGIQRFDEGRFYNALILTDQTGQTTAVYDKHHLVPFGEYMPLPGLFKRIGIAGLAARAEGGYSAGAGPMPFDIPGLGRVLPLICYETVFPQDLNRADFRADWILHATNDAWFGSWSGPYQHLAQARIRAIEQGLPVLRAANTGVSAAIDGAGRVVAALTLNETGFLDVPLPPPLRVTVYSRIGDWPLFVVLFCALAFCVLRARSESD